MRTSPRLTVSINVALKIRFFPFVAANRQPDLVVIRSPLAGLLPLIVISVLAAIVKIFPM